MVFFVRNRPHYYQDFFSPAVSFDDMLLADIVPRTTYFGSPLYKLRSGNNKTDNELSTQTAHALPRLSSFLSNQRNVHVAEDNDEELLLAIDLPGVKADDLNVELDGEVLKVSHSVKDDKQSFSLHTARTFVLDETKFDLANVSVEHADGVLSVHAPKKPAAKVTRHTISIRSGSDDDTVDKGHSRWTLDVPGIKASDLQITVEGDKLSINGERKSPKDPSRVISKLDRTVTLDRSVDPTNIKAFLSDGVLTLVFPKKVGGDEPSKRLLEIKTKNEISVAKKESETQDETWQEIEPEIAAEDRASCAESKSEASS